MRRYSDSERAAIWALRCQDFAPIDIRRALERDEAGLGYPLKVPKRSMQDLLRRLEREHGPPAATIAPGEDAAAIDSIRREAIGTIRARVLELRAKRARGDELTAADIRTLDAAARAADSFEDRRRRSSSKAKQTANARDAQDSAPSALVRQLAAALEREPVPTDPD